MSTRGRVAWPLPDGTHKGVYNHDCSEPAALGAAVFAEAKTRGLKALVAILKSCGDWREIRGGVCQYCGKVAGQAHSISAMIAVTARSGSEYPDPGALYHKHGGREEDQFDPFDDPLSMEWVYVLVPERDLIEVWAHASHNRARAKNWSRWSGVKYKAFSGNVWTHVHVADIRVSEPEPDWNALEARGLALTD